MAADVDVRVIKKTQDSLGTIIKKPPMNEKLLKKPPFRFLHDIITNTISTTGFLDGLYTADELNSENVKEKESKIAFLQKAIDVVSMVTGQTLAARPSKIVAGQEATKTNEFLQALAKALSQKHDSADAVQRVLNGEKPAPEKKTSRSTPASKSKTRDGATRPTKTPEKIKDLSIKTKDTPSKTRDVSKVSKPRDTSRSKVTSKRPKDEPKTTKTEKPEKKVAEKPAEEPPPSLPPEPVLIPTVQPDTVESKPNSATFLSEPLATPPPPTPKPEHIPSPPLPPEPESKPEPSPVKESHPSPSARPAAPSRQSRHRQSAKSKQGTAVELSPKSPKVKRDIPKDEPAKHEPIQPPEPAPIPSYSGEPVPRPQSVMRARSARPSTARPAPPRIINRNIVNPEENNLSTASKPIANLILDTDSKDTEEDQGFVVEDTAVTESEDLSAIPSTSDAPMMGGLGQISGETSVTSKEEEEAAQQGSLVRQMLQTKKGLEGGSQANRKGEPELLPENKPQSSQQQETTSKELEQLRQFIQTVSRSANPLGKMLDYLQEDIDSMNAELRTWREEHQQNLVALRREEGVTENMMDPLNKQLEELEQAVQEQRDQISALMAAVLHNDQRIRRMLTTSHKA